MPSHLRHQTELHGSAGSSGGYLEFVLRAAAWELFGKVLPLGPLPMKALRNPDMQVSMLGLLLQMFPSFHPSLLLGVLVSNTAAQCPAVEQQFLYGTG